MGERKADTTPFQSGQQSNAKGFPAEKSKVKFNVSKMRNAGQPDPLGQALKGRNPPLLPSDNHLFRHSKASAPRGAHYTPAREFGSPSGPWHEKATKIGSHTSRPGGNAVGRPDGGRGGNPLGRPMNKQGLNVIGGHGGRGTFRGNP